MNPGLKRALGNNGPRIFPIGLGCMGLTGSYGSISAADAERVIAAAIDHGISLLDTADFYGGGQNEQLLGCCLRRTGKRAVIATKTGLKMGPDRQPLLTGRPDQIVSACEASLMRLGVEAIDLYLLARIDPAVPVEDSVGAMANLVSQGKVRAVGLSEASVETIRRANSVFPLSALETEYSLAERGVEARVQPALGELGMTLVAYSPFGRGLLTGSLNPDAAFEQGDFRNFNPRFSKENIAANLEKVSALTRISRSLGVTNTQVALAWLLSKGGNVIPIFGTRSVDRVKENVRAASMKLPQDIVSYLDETFSIGWTKGERYPPSQMKLTESFA